MILVSYQSRWWCGQVDLFGFSCLPKNTSACGQEAAGDQPVNSTISGQSALFGKSGGLYLVDPSLFALLLLSHTVILIN